MAESPRRYCGNCGNELSPEDQFCRSCGTPVHQAARVPTSEADVEPPPSPEPHRRTAGQTILGLALLVSGLLCVLCFGLFLSDPRSGDGTLLWGFGLLAAATLYGAWRNLRRTP